MKLAVLAIVTACLVSAAAPSQEQTSARANWPCGARVDPAYFHGAEATGGQLLLLAPSEIIGSMDALSAFDKHPETIFRMGGTINPGVHDFRVPIDSSVESAMFSITVQCLQTAEVFRPSGAGAAGDGVRDLSNFLAMRMMIVSKPESGLWTVRLSGSGLAGVIVKAHSVIDIATVEFAPAGTTGFTALPVAGRENVVRIYFRGEIAHPHAALLDATSKQIAELPLDAGQPDGVYQSRFTPGVEGFRIMMTGTGEDGTTVQRVYAPLFSAR